MLAGRGKGRGTTCGVIVAGKGGSRRRLEPGIDSIEAHGQNDYSDTHQDEYDGPTLHCHRLSLILFISWLDFCGTLSHVNGVVCWKRSSVVIWGGSRKACHCCFVEYNSCSRPFIYVLNQKVCENNEERSSIIRCKPAPIFPVMCFTSRRVPPPRKLQHHWNIVLVLASRSARKLPVRSEGNVHVSDFTCMFCVPRNK
jgi:hypothetical protein